MAGALARDVLFERVSPATFALQSLTAHHRKMMAEQQPNGEEVKKEEEEEGQEEGAEGTATAAKGDEKPAVKKEEEEETEATPGKEREKDSVTPGEKDKDTHEDEEEEQEEEDSENEEEATERRLRDEAHMGEHWVAMLREHDYDGLPFEERVSMLTSLCQLVLESPTVREMLEKRLEEQQRIKRILWEESKAEATIQKQRRQAEQAAKSRAAAEEAQKAVERVKAMQNGGEGVAAPMDVDAQGVAPSTAAASGGEQQQQQQQQGDKASAAAEAAIAAATEAAAAEDREASAKRAQARAEAVLREMEVHAVRAEPLGLDRRYNRYWRFVRGLGAGTAVDSTNNNGTAAAAGGIIGPSKSGGGGGGSSENKEKDNPSTSKSGAGTEDNKESKGTDTGTADKDVRGTTTSGIDPGDGRIFVESQEDGMLRVICTKEDLETLISSLDRRGPREKGLYASLLRHKSAVVAAMPAVPLSPPQEKPPPRSVAQLQKLYKLAVLETDKKDKKKGKKLPKPFVPGEIPEMTILKFDLLAVEFSLAEEVLDEDFDPAVWRPAVQAATEVEQLRKCLGELESAIDASALHPDFNREPALVKGAWIPIGEEVATALPGNNTADIAVPMSPLSRQKAESAEKGNGKSDDEEEEEEEGEGNDPAHLSWLPPTLSAVALRLAALDAALKYNENDAARETLLGYRHVLRPGRLPGAEENGLLLGPALNKQGKIRPVLMPPFPYRMLFTPRVDFSFDVAKFQEHVAMGSDELVIAAHTGRGKGTGRTGGRPKGSKNKPKAGGVTPGGRGGGGTGGGGLRKKAGQGGAHRSALGKELGARSDSDRHYGSDFEQEEDGDDYASGMLPPGSGPYRQSREPSAPPSTIGDDDEDREEIEEEAEEGEPEDRPEDFYKPEDDDDDEEKEGGDNNKGVTNGDDEDISDEDSDIEVD